MKKIELFVCETCGTQYAEKLECTACEKSHRKPVEITGARYLGRKQNGSGYPVAIHVKMSDGETITFKR